MERKIKRHKNQSAFKARKGIQEKSKNRKNKKNGNIVENTKKKRKQKKK